MIHCLLILLLSSSSFKSELSIISHLAVKNHSLLDINKIIRHKLLHFFRAGNSPLLLPNTLKFFLFEGENISLVFFYFVFFSPNIYRYYSAFRRYTRGKCEYLGRKKCSNISTFQTYVRHTSPHIFSILKNKRIRNFKEKCVRLLPNLK